MSIERSRHETDSSGALLSTAPGTRAYWSPAEAESLLALWTQKLPAGEIAIRLGKTSSAVKAKASRLGLPHRKDVYLADLTFVCQECGQTETRQRRFYATGILVSSPPSHCAGCQQRHVKTYRQSKRTPGPSRPNLWPEDRRALLISLWEQDLSAAKIGERLGVTKNAIIGIINRMGLSGKRRPVRQVKPKTQKPSRPRYFPSRRGQRAFAGILSPAVPALPSLNHTIIEATGCRYPYGNGPYTFCGHPKHEGSSYCPAHKKACHL
jgi:GcrA cell cycle regulator